jgi:hypothetical protein
MKRLNLKKILKWTGIVTGGLLAIGLVANALFVWTTDTRLERQLAAIRKSGDPLTLADLARPPIPPEKNAATYLHRAEGDVEAIEKELRKLWFAKENAEYFDSPYIPMPPKIQKATKAALDAHPNVIPLLEKAAACPDYDAGMEYCISPEEFDSKFLAKMNTSRAPIRILDARAQLLVNEGKRDEAVRTSLMIFQLARHYDRNPTLVGGLIAMAVRGNATKIANLALQTGAVPNDVRDALNKELELQERSEGFSWMMKSERAFVLWRFNTMPIRNFWLFSRGFWNLQESKCLEILQVYVDVALDTGPYRQTHKMIERSHSQISKMDIMAALLVPAIKAAHQAAIRSRAQIRCLRVLNAIQTHTQKGNDDIPKLSELGLPAETTSDPFTSEPLKVKKTPRGWLIYSVGPDYKDDGGKIDNSSPDGDVGIGPPPPAEK